MSQDSDITPRRRFTRVRMFRLFTLFVLAALIAAAIAYFTRPVQKEVSAEIFFRPPTPLFPERNADAMQTDAEWRRFIRLQPALLKSPFVINRALNAPKIADLPIMKTQAEPIEFLSQRLETSMRDGDVMTVKMLGRAI